MNIGKRTIATAELLPHFEVVQEMQGFVEDKISELLKPVSENWQPAELLPEMSSGRWAEELRELRRSVETLSDDIFVVLVGDMATEEAVPSYQSWLNGLKGITDASGTGNNPWAQWVRGWSAEENRHGDLLNRYLYLSGRVDMKAVEKTVHHLIRNGFDPKTENDPYLGFVYTSFQERATKISHCNVAILASKSGEERLQNICGLIAGDEARHEKAYTSFMKRIFEIDPVGAVLAFEKMMRARIVMPGERMGDRENNALFNEFSLVAQRIGVYTARDYASITAHLVESWGVKDLTGLSDEAAEAQDYLCSLPERYEKVAQRIAPTGRKMKFAWIYDREI